MNTADDTAHAGEETTGNPVIAFKKEGSIVALTTKMRLRLSGLVKERTDVLGFFPNKDK